MTPSASASGMSLPQYHWKNRLVLVFTPSASDLRFMRQQALFEQRKADLTDRDIVVLPIVGPSESRVRSQFRVAPGEFSVVLVGKDGNEKHRWVDIAPVDQINHRIDRMPMRRVEMKNK